MVSVAPAPTRPHVRLGWGWWTWAMLVVAGVTVTAWTGSVLAGGLLAASGFLLAAVLRLVLPTDGAGGLHVRGPRTDVLVHAAFAVVVVLAALLVHLREGL